MVFYLVAFLSRFRSGAARAFPLVVVPGWCAVRLWRFFPDDPVFFLIVLFFVGCSRAPVVSSWGSLGIFRVLALLCMCSGTVFLLCLRLGSWVGLLGLLCLVLSVFVFLLVRWRLGEAFCGLCILVG